MRRCLICDNGRTRKCGFIKLNGRVSTADAEGNDSAKSNKATATTDDEVAEPVTGAPPASDYGGRALHVGKAYYSSFATLLLPLPLGSIRVSYLNRGLPLGDHCDKAWRRLGPLHREMKHTPGMISAG